MIARKVTRFYETGPRNVKYVATVKTLLNKCKNILSKVIIAMCNSRTS